VHLAGSAPLRAALPPGLGPDSGPSLLVDVAAEMPRAAFDEKDFKRGRYLVRRAAWLQGAKAALERAVAEAGKRPKKGKGGGGGRPSPLRGAAVTWTDLGGDARRPCLLVSLPSGPSSPGGVALRLVPAAPSELAATWLPRLAPDRGNLGGAGGGADGGPPPSPRYNALVVADFFPDAELEDLRFALGACPAAADGVTLVRLWARTQRLSFSSSSAAAGSSPAASDGDGEDTSAAPLLSSRALAAAAASAASAGRLARAMSALQAARAIWREVEAAAGKGASPRFGESWEGVSAGGGGRQGAGAAAAAAPAATVLSSPSLPLPHASYPRPPPVSSFLKSGGGGGVELVVLSCGGHLNLAAAGAAAAATAAAGRRVAAAAAAAIAALDAARGPGGDPEGCVDALWLRGRVAPWLVDYDAFWRVGVPLPPGEGGAKRRSGGAAGGKTASAAAAAAAPAPAPAFSTSAPPLSGDCPAASALESRVEAIARTALGGRVSEVRAVPRRRLRSHPSEGPAAAPSASLSASAPAPPAAPAAAEAEAGNASFSFVTLAGRANPSAFSRRADLGPPADSGRAAAAFRAFWGELSDLRRFGDGAIREAVVWGGSQSSSHSSPAAAADAALAAAMRRHAAPGAAVSGLTDSLEPALAERGGGSGGAGAGSGGVRELQQQQQQQSQSALSSSAALDAALSKLSKALRGLPGANSAGGGGEEAANGECGVALRPVGVAATSSSLGRRTAPFPPAPHPLLLLALQQQQQQQHGKAAAASSSSSRGRKGSGGGSGSGASGIPLLPSPTSPLAAAVVPRTLPAVEVAVQLEGSGRWPQDAGAAAKMKAALACQLAERLEGDYGFRARAFEVDAPPSLKEGGAATGGGGAGEGGGSGGGGGGGGFDVFVDGFAFRCLLWSPRDDAAVAAAKARERAAAKAAAARAAAAAAAKSSNAALLAPPPPTTTPADAAALRSYCGLRARIDHAAALAAVAGSSPGFSRGGRLLIRWAGAHLLLPPPLSAAAASNAGAPPPPALVPALELVAAAASGPRLAGGSGSGLCPLPSAAANASGGPSSSSAAAVEAEEETLLRPAAAAAGSAAAPPSTALAVFAAALRLLAERGRSSSSAEATRPLLVDPLGQMGASERAKALRGEAGEGGEGEDGDALSRRQRQRRQLSQEEERKRRASLSAQASPLALASAVDPSGALWTRQVDPATVVRLSRLARRALAGMEAALLSGGGAERRGGPAARPPPPPCSPPSLLEAAFSPALADWDALLWLKPSALPAGGRRAPPRPAAPPAAPPGRPGRLPADGSAGRCGAAIACLPAAPGRGAASPARASAALVDELLVGFDPVACFVRALAARFGAVAAFGCDGAGGESPVVGVRWLAGARRAWPPGAGPLAQAATAPTTTTAAAAGAAASPSSPLPLVLSVELDEEATLAAMCAAGGGIADGFSVVRPLRKKENGEGKRKEKKKKRSSDDDDGGGGGGSGEEDEEEEEKSHRRTSKARRRL